MAGGGPSSPSTVVVSDLHLTEAEPVDPRRPLWKRFKRRDLFIDASFERLLRHIRASSEGPIELVLAGDVFDFDAVMALPQRPPFEMSWLERTRGLASSEPKSRFKMRVILRDHPTWLRAVSDWLAAGNSVVIVIGNHDMELHWPGVQAELVEALGLEPDQRDRLRFCAWFYPSGGDTLVMHGNQFDPYCVCQDPVHPLVRVRGETRVRLPFGNLAGKLMLNGMGLFNPHVESSFILSIREYISFFLHYLVRVQPLLLWTWLWSATATLLVSLRDGFLPAVRDPFTIEARVGAVAKAAGVQPPLVRALRALDVHPAIFNPWRVARELWLDRALLLAGVAWFAFQAFSFLNVFTRVSPLWALLLFALLLPPLLFYARGVNSEVGMVQRVMARRIPAAARLAGVRRVVLGHTHIELHTTIDGIDVLNTGTWSPAYQDVECTRPLGRKCYAWIHPGPEGAGRVAELLEWTDPGTRVVPYRPQPEPPAGILKWGRPELIPPPAAGSGPAAPGAAPPAGRRSRARGPCPA